MTRWLIATFAVAAAGVAGCGDDNGEQVRTVTVTAPAEAQQDPLGDAILIRTHITSAKNHSGRVLPESFLGEAPFCRGGKETGGGADPIIETFTCSDGSLKVEFAVKQPSSAQSAAWKVASGTGRYKGLRGGGTMAVSFSSRSNGGETFTGTVSK